ncbi:MAG: DUF1223 domain-containing protein [Reyranellaceae bacterium]
MKNSGFSRRRSLLLGGAAAASAAFTAAPAGADPRGSTEGPWAVELFTSQGCNSCPPADAYLGLLAKRTDIVALSFHIDYWDYIGWKDPFASRATTDRQRAYARVLKQRYVYTPEMVVDGIGHDTGRDRGVIEALLVEARRRSPRRATPDLSRGGDGRLAIRLAAFPLDGKPADVTIAVYDRRHSTPVASGENQGRTIDNFNVVRRFDVLARWDGAEAAWSVDTTDLQQGQGIAVIVQRADHGPVIGCNKIEPMVSG